MLEPFFVPIFKFLWDTGWYFAAGVALIAIVRLAWKWNLRNPDKFPESCEQARTAIREERWGQRYVHALAWLNRRLANWIGDADQAALHTSHYKQLLDSFNRQQISAAWYAGKAGVPAIFPLAYKAQLSQLDGNQGAKNILQSAKQINKVLIAEAELDIDYANQLITEL